MIIKVMGSGNDVVCVYGADGGDEEYYTYEKPPLMWRADLIAPGGATATLHALCYGGCWHISVGQPFEDAPFPEWPMSHSADSPYSVGLTIDAPAGTRLDNIWPEPPKED